MGFRDILVCAKNMITDCIHSICHQFSLSPRHITQFFIKTICILDVAEKNLAKLLHFLPHILESVMWAKEFFLSTKPNFFPRIETTFACVFEPLSEVEDASKEEEASASYVTTAFKTGRP